VSDVGCRMSDVGCRMSDVGCRMSDVGCRMSDKKKRSGEHCLLCSPLYFFSKISNQKSDIRHQTFHIIFYSISHNQPPQQYNRKMPILFLVVSFHRVVWPFLFHRYTDTNSLRHRQLHHYW